MKNILFSLLLISSLLLLSACSVSRRVTSIQEAPTDSAFAANKIELPEIEKKYSKYDGVFLQLRDIYEHSASTGGLSLTDWKYHHVYRNKYIILNPDNENLSTVTITVHPAAMINSAYVMTLSPSGEIKRFRLEDMNKDTTFGYMRYKFAIPEVKKGTIVEKGLDVTYNAFRVRPPLQYDFELQFPLPCEDLELQFAYPDWWKIMTTKNFFATQPEYQSVSDEKQNKQTISYKAKNIPAVTEEPFSPYFKEMAKYFELTISSLSSSDYNIRTWKEFANEFRRYAMNNEGIFTTAVRAKTNTLVNDSMTSLQKLNTIVEYLQKDISVAEEYKERDFPDVINDRTGNIFEICGLAQAMLSKAGLTTDYLLVHSAKNGRFDENYISFDQFSSPAVKVTIDNRDYVVVPYLKNLPADHIPEYLQNQPALIISNDKLRNGVIWSVPNGNYLDNRYIENYELQIDETGNISIKENKVLTGSFAYDVREGISKLKKDELEKFLRDLLTYTDGNIKIVSYSIENQDEYKKDLVLKLEYVIDNLVTVTPEEVIFQTSGLFSPASIVKLKIKPEERNNPIRVYNNQSYEKNIKIVYPEKWKLVTQLKDINYSNKIGKITGTYKVAGNVIDISQQSKLNKCSEPKEKITELLDITGTSSKLSLPTLIFSAGN